MENLKGTADLSPSNVVSVDIDTNPSPDDNINPDGGTDIHSLFYAKTEHGNFEPEPIESGNNGLRCLDLLLC